MADESSYDPPTIEDAGFVSPDAAGAIRVKAAGRHPGWVPSGAEPATRRVLCPACRGHLPPDYCETCDNTGKVEQRKVA